MSTPSDLEQRDPERAPGGTLFFSYARADQARVLPIIRALEASGHDVWWDGLIESGARFAQQTEQALENAAAVVVVWSEHSVTSHWVTDEATSARHRNVLIPVSIDGSAAPIGFRQFQVIDLSTWTGDPAAAQFQRVLRGIDSVTAVSHAAQPAAQHRLAMLPPAAASAPLLSRRMMLLGAAGGTGLAALTGAWYFGLLDNAASADRGIAVMPFENIGGGTARDYFADGLSAELRSQLSRNTALRVIAQSSSLAAAEGGGDAATIASRLGVAFLLEGNVRWSGEAVRISANLINRATNSDQWSKTFDLTMDDIFAVQSEIAAAVTAAITEQIVDDRDVLDIGGTTNANAYDQFLRGRDLYSRASSEEMDLAALAYFDAAVAADPVFAAAHAARARSLTLIGSLYGNLSETRANYAAALIAARRAVSLAPNHAESQSTLGFVLSQAQLDVRSARAPFDRARTLGNGDANVLARFAQFAAQTGRFEEARAAIDRAVTLDPLNPLMLKSAGLIAYWAHDFARALPPMERALALEPDLGTAYAPMGDVLYMLGQLPEALAAYRREQSPLLRDTGLAIVSFRLGRRPEAEAARRRIVTGLGTGQVTYYQQAQIAAQWTEPDAAMLALRAARAAGDSGLITLKVDPLLDPLRRRGDFNALLTTLQFQ